MFFSSSQVQMWELDRKEGWAFKLWCWRRLLRIPWRARSSKLSILNEINPNIHQKDWCWSSNTLATWCKKPDAGKDWGQEEKGTVEAEVVEWNHWLNGLEFEQTPGDGEGQGSLACCSPLQRVEHNRTTTKVQYHLTTTTRRCMVSRSRHPDASAG